jgi:hypothetical protein
MTFKTLFLVAASTGDAMIPEQTQQVGKTKWQEMVI